MGARNIPGQMTPAKGWDGNYLGNPVQNGNYVYHVQYINGVGMLTEKTDVVKFDSITIDYIKIKSPIFGTFFCDSELIF